MPPFFTPLLGYQLKRASIWIAAIDVLILLTLGTFRLYALDWEATQQAIGKAAKNLDLHKLENETHQAEVEEIFQVAIVKSHFFIRFFAISALQVLYFLLEVWLCRLLIRSSKRGNETGLKWWMVARTVITVLTVMLCAIEIHFSLKRNILDWTLEVVTIYRIFELVVIYELRREVIATGPAERV
ncbi:hypothetical protein Ocin01_14468 [Orchesella cincta]|uniref:Uncharacterized protein n=1 Tax=Orchesella cincta TaxID=48709 RepID=A0A1D2MGU6_ORCCI|nr:hypothetical protein Ocin01_14468 [Orchesella cincta]